MPQKSTKGTNENQIIVASAVRATTSSSTLPCRLPEATSGCWICHRPDCRDGLSGPRLYEIDRHEFSERVAAEGHPYESAYGSHFEIWCSSSSR